MVDAAVLSLAQPVPPLLNGCPICAATVGTLVRMRYIDQQCSHLPQAENPFTGLEILVCGSCGFGYATPAVDVARLERFYRHQYRAPGSVHALGSSGPWRARLDPRAVAQVLLAKLFRTFHTGESFLDIGPGQGASLDALAQVCPGLQASVIEPDESAAQWLRQRAGVQVIAQSLDPRKPCAGSPPGNTFELILMSHVLEHVNGVDAVAWLMQVKPLLSDDGIMICEVPHCDLRQHAERRDNDAPHLGFFSQDSLARVFQQAGLTVKFLETCGPTYADWWSNRCNGTTRATPSAPRRWLVNTGKALLSCLPTKMADELVTRIRPERCAELLGSEELCYGGDRTCLRIVAAR